LIVHCANDREKETGGGLPIDGLVVGKGKPKIIQAANLALPYNVTYLLYNTDQGLTAQLN